MKKRGGRKYPEQVVLAITKNAEGRVNLIAVGWVCIGSDEPPMFLIGIDDNAYTIELIRESKEFVIAYPSSAMAKETLYVGTTHGHNEDKATKSGLEFAPAGIGQADQGRRQEEVFKKLKANAENTVIGKERRTNDLGEMALWRPQTTGK